jgi:hypothetical protein
MRSCKIIAVGLLLAPLVALAGMASGTAYLGQLADKGALQWYPDVYPKRITQVDVEEFCVASFYFGSNASFDIDMASVTNVVEENGQVKVYGNVTGYYSHDSGEAAGHIKRTVARFEPTTPAMLDDIKNAFESMQKDCGGSTPHFTR